MYPQPSFSAAFSSKHNLRNRTLNFCYSFACITNRQCLPVDRAAAGTRCSDVSSASYTVFGQPLFGVGRRQHSIEDLQDAHGPLGVSLLAYPFRRSLGFLFVRHDVPALGTKIRMGRALRGIAICDRAFIFNAYTKLSMYSFPTMAASAPLLSFRRTLRSHSRVKSSLNEAATVSISSRDKLFLSLGTSGFFMRGEPLSMEKSAAEFYGSRATCQEGTAKKVEYRPSRGNKQLAVDMTGESPISFRRGER